MYKIAVLLATYNGSEFLEELLKSLEDQKKVSMKIFAIDDDSTDNTLNILKKTKIPIKIFKSKKYKNPTKNFIYLIQNVPMNFDYYCFCDQDDVWKKNKLDYSIKKIKAFKAEVLGSRTFYTDKKLNVWGKSILFKKKLSLNNSLVQSICGGNTQIWTKKFQKILKEIGFCNPASHDWMVYQIAMVMNAKFIYLKKPLIYYRQHGNNKIGANTGLTNLLKRIFWGLCGRYKFWHDQNKKHLIKLSKKKYVDKKNTILIREFYNLRNEKNPIKKIIKLFFKLKVYRQTIGGNIMLFFATLFNKI